MDNQPRIIKGGAHTDDRGTISFVNDFDMNFVRRFYIIKHADTLVIRGWRAHRIEQRWFHVLEGEFLIRLVKIDNWEHPDPNAAIIEFNLLSKKMQVLHVPPGYASAIQAKKANSTLMVFADRNIEHAKADDYLFDVNYFVNFS